MKAHITNIRTEKKYNTTCKYVDICPLASKCDEFQEYSEKCDSKLYTHRRHGKNRRKHREFEHKRFLDMMMKTLEEILEEGSKGTIFDPEHPDHDKPFITGLRHLSKDEGIDEDSIEKIRNAFLAVLGDDGSDTE